MTTVHTRARALSVLTGHQPDDLNTTPTTIRCTCGEEIPRAAEALAVHQVHELLVLDLLRADPTPPLTLTALRDLRAGEVVFDPDGVPWMSCGDVVGEAVWVTTAEGLPDELLVDDLFAERSPLSLYREVSR